MQGDVCRVDAVTANGRRRYGPPGGPSREQAQAQDLPEPVVAQAEAEAA